MKIKVDGQTVERRAVWWEDGKVWMIDQRQLPFRYSEVSFSTPAEVGQAIKDMVVRGAPSIGVAAAYGVALDLVCCEQLFTENEMGAFLEETFQALNTRPTAKDLTTALDIVGSTIQKVFRDEGMERAREVALEAARWFDNETVRSCELIGEHGAELISDGAKVLTHCNAGALAAQDYGTALAPIRKAHEQGKGLFVYVDETRPRNQGARLTAWELSNEDIDHRIIADNAAGFYMSKGEVDLVIVGADRVVANGDVANKIGTYEKAVVAKENGIPFYVAIPWSTFDPGIASGEDIPIEERDDEEVLTTFVELDGKVQRLRCSDPSSQGLNPAFDVTPARFVTGYITPEGVLTAEDLAKRLS